MGYTPRIMVSLLILVLLASLMSGCWDRRELEEQAFILTLGIDKGTSEGSYLWTFQLAVPRQLAGGGGGGGGGGRQNPSTTVSVEATTLFGALNLLNSFIDRKANLMHAKAVIVSETVARNDPVPLRTFNRYREVRRNLFVMVAEGKAKDIISAYRPVLEQNPAKFIETLVLNSSFTALVPRTQLQDYLNALESKSVKPTAILVGQTGGLAQPKKLDRVTAPFLPGEIPREGGNPVEIIGIAVFKGAKMVGKLTGTENRSMALLNGKFKRGFLSFPDPLAPGKSLALDVRAGSPPVIKVDLQGKRPLVTVHLSLEGDILDIQSSVNYTRLDMLKQLEQFTEKQIATQALEVIKKTQAMGSDIFGFGDIARHSVKTWAQWEELNWTELYPKAKINLTVDFSIRRIGVAYQPPKPGV